jgi:hypothetical protein
MTESAEMGALRVTAKTLEFADRVGLVGGGNPTDLASVEEYEVTGPTTLRLTPTCPLPVSPEQGAPEATDYTATPTSIVFFYYPNDETGRPTQFARINRYIKK